MLGTTVNYRELRDFLLTDGKAEWVFMPFKDNTFLREQYQQEAKQKGFIIEDDWDYSPTLLDVLQNEEEGIIHDCSFGPGRNEGYSIVIRFTTGQVVRIKTFDNYTMNRVFEWISGKGQN
ncbi:hypothetical protein P9G84_31505 [Brevibacillus centrosporus]|uniref:hypothetical protein n=1 Tax=Brevibacillus centrosporus TaxID=54910 RepID=UPI001141C7AE|nr:hypothetical protein [Brevibacillus centrosporus]MEC2133385.1 hypothetical protein [Brevibacillus centrosporus]GED34874.1 hypothetical protein BCE02nite_60150 [Brevibacillus centrosporus]